MFIGTAHSTLRAILMPNLFELLQAELLGLSKADRSQLLDQDAETEQAWEEVAEERAAAMVSGATQGVPLEEVIAVLEAKFPE